MKCFIWNLKIRLPLKFHFKFLTIFLIFSSIINIKFNIFQTTTSTSANSMSRLPFIPTTSTMQLRKNNCQGRWIWLHTTKSQILLLIRCTLEMTMRKRVSYFGRCYFFVFSKFLLSFIYFCTYSTQEDLIDFLFEECVLTWCSLWQ